VAALKGEPWIGSPAKSRGAASVADAQAKLADTLVFPSNLAGQIPGSNTASGCSTDAYVTPAPNVAEPTADAGLDLVRRLRSTGERERAVALLPDLMAKSGKRTKTDFREQGGIPAIVSLLAEGSMIARENAAHSVTSLCHQEKGNKAAVREAGGIALLTELLAKGSPGGKEKAAGALRCLAKLDAANQQAIANPETVGHLVRLLSEGSPAQQDHAAGAIAEIGQHDQGRALLLAAGAATPLRALATSTSPEAGGLARIAKCALFFLNAVRLDSAPGQ